MSHSKRGGVRFYRTIPTYLHLQHVSECGLEILVNKLKSVVSKLIGEFQASFILGRSTIDNVVVDKELIHSLSKKKGRKGSFVLKVALEKAYDMID